MAVLQFLDELRRDHRSTTKTIKRAMYGRAGPELLRARMMPIKMADLHTKVSDVLIPPWLDNTELAY
jgi:hypothetical protein